MCTLVAIHRVVPGRWLVVAANRDEFLDRPSEGPKLWRGDLGRGGPLVAPTDIRAGGTWLGVNRHGVFSALTNLRSATRDQGRISRGKVVVDSLRVESAVEAAAVLESLPAGSHNPFNFFVADQEHAFLAVYDEEIKLRKLNPGVYVIGNGNPLETPEPGLMRLQSRVDSVVAGQKEDLIETLAAFCREHTNGGGSLEDLCVHMGDRYGTRSSILLELNEFVGREAEEVRRTGGGSIRKGSRLLYADGPPCQAPYEDRSFLLDELRRTPGYESAEIRR